MAEGTGLRAGPRAAQQSRTFHPHYDWVIVTIIAVAASVSRAISALPLEPTARLLIPNWEQEAPEQKLSPRREPQPLASPLPGSGDG